MDNKITLSYEKITIRKQGAFQPNEDGEFWVRVGGLNVYNNLGIFYIDGVDKYSLRQALKDSTSTIRRKMAKNQLHGEAGHPNWVPGYNDDKFYERNMYVDPKCCSHTFRNITLTDTNECVDKLGIGGNVSYIDALIFPFGPYGDALKAALMNEKENVSFSIRAITDMFYIKSCPVRRLKDIITWDWVCEGGIEQANQFNYLKYNMAIESYNKSSTGIYTGRNIETEPTNMLTVESIRSIELTPKLLDGYLEKAEKMKELGLEADYSQGVEITKSLLEQTSTYKFYRW